MGVCLAALTPTWAADYSRHNFTVGLGGADPQGEIRSFMSAKPGVSVGYGYRFLKYFQADIGLDIIFGAALVRDFLTTQVGDFRVSDREYVLPMGGRAILPFAGGRVLFSGGGGWAWMRYGERVNQPSYYFRIDCPICTVRSGWGYYAQLNGTYFLDYGKHFRVGATTRFVRGHTEGEPVGNIPGIRTTDHWMNVFGEFGLSF